MGTIVVCSGSITDYDEMISIGCSDGCGKPIHSPPGIDFWLMETKPLFLTFLKDMIACRTAVSALGGLICLILEVLVKCCKDYLNHYNIKLNRKFIVELLKLLTKYKAEYKDKEYGYGVICMYHFFRDPEHFIIKLQIMRKISYSSEPQT